MAHEGPLLVPGDFRMLPRSPTNTSPLNAKLTSPAPSAGQRRPCVGSLPLHEQIRRATLPTEVSSILEREDFTADTLRDDPQSLDMLLKTSLIRCVHAPALVHRIVQLGLAAATTPEVASRVWTALSESIYEVARWDHRVQENLNGAKTIRDLLNQWEFQMKELLDDSAKNAFSKACKQLGEKRLELSPAGQKDRRLQRSLSNS